MLGRLRAMGRSRSKEYGSPSPQPNMHQIRPGSSPSFIRQQQFERFRSHSRKDHSRRDRSEGPVIPITGGYAEEDQSFGSPSGSGDESDTDSDDEPWYWCVIFRLFFYCTLLVLLGFVLGIVAEEVGWFSWEVFKARMVAVWKAIRAFRMPKEFSTAVGNAGDLSDYGSDLNYVGLSSEQGYNRAGAFDQRYHQHYDQQDSAW